jgi:hypothetical protein
VKVRVLGCCGRAGGAGFGLALRWRVWLGWARRALSSGGVFKRIGAVLSFRFAVGDVVLSKHRLHRTFRLELINALLEYPLESEAIGRVPEDINGWPGHQWSKFPTRNYCKWCRMTLRARHRAPLTEVVNEVHPRARARGRMTLGGCQKCNVYLCSSGTCFRQFHSFKSW